MTGLSALPLTGGAHDRSSGQRRDGAWLAAARSDPRSRTVVVRGEADLLVAAGERSALFTRPPAELDGDAPLVLLGVDGERVAWFALDAGAALDSGEPAPPGAHFADLRAIGPVLSGAESNLAAQALGVLVWHRRHQRCSVCGAPTTQTEAGYSRTCGSCGALHFPRTDPAVIMLVTAGDRCVLGRQPIWPRQMWSALAGFVEPGESLEAAVVREVAEEVGLAVTAVRYQASQPWPFPSSLMLGFRAEAGFAPLQVDEELEAARWFTRDELLEAIADGSVALPPPVSIAHHLIRAWLDE